MDRPVCGAHFNYPIPGNHSWQRPLREKQHSESNLIGNQGCKPAKDRYFQNLTEHYWVIAALFGYYFCSTSFVLLISIYEKEFLPTNVSSEYFFASLLDLLWHTFLIVTRNLRHLKVTKGESHFNNLQERMKGLRDSSFFLA